MLYAERRASAPAVVQRAPATKVDSPSVVVLGETSPSVVLIGVKPAPAPREGPTTRCMSKDSPASSMDLVSHPNYWYCVPVSAAGHMHLCYLRSTAVSALLPVTNLVYNHSHG